MSTEHQAAQPAEAAAVAEPAAEQARAQPQPPAPDVSQSRPEEAESKAGTDRSPDRGGEQPDGPDPRGAQPTGPRPEHGAEEDEQTGTSAPSPLSEAEAELAAQRVERERIARRKAERAGPVEAGAKLSGTAADLLAAVRAVESGRTPQRPVVEAPAPSRPAPAPAEQPVGRHLAPSGQDGPVAPGTALVEAVTLVLTEGQAPASLAAPAARVFGEGAAQLLREDPWRLLAVPGVRPAQADGFARALLGAGCRPDDVRRSADLVSWLLEQAAFKGHTVLESSVLEAALARYSVPDPDRAVRAAVTDGAVLVFQEPADERAPVDSAQGEGAQEQPVRTLLGAEGLALAEESLAEGLARLINTFDAATAGSGLPEGWRRSEAEAPSPSAAQLLRAAAGHGLVTHTGGEAARAEPVALVRAARALGLRAFAASHTVDGRDRAAAAGLGEAAVTTFGLLATTEGPGRDTEGALAIDLLVVLDAQQLDVEGAAVLVESVPDGARLVLSGDPATLGSPGPGRVFADLLAARACPQVVSRTPDPGPLGELVSAIGIGELVQVDAPGKEIVIVPVEDAGEAVHRTVQLVADSVPRALDIPAPRTQVVTVGHGGSAGTRVLNCALKERLNPGPGRFAGFDPGDRVVYTPTAHRVVPASVVGAEPDGLRLECASGSVFVPKGEVERVLRHGWAVTAAQAVGFRWPAVVVVLPGDAAEGLSRDWVYTAFGRAEQHLSVVHGVDQALGRAVREVGPKQRSTRLTALLRGLIADSAVAG
ncbi:helix-hairpin-helix domain-containing protein [Streptomyces sp. NPDC006879]|uniref:helix-hairpin-helix domain-containing protein n=1 Tax=Streptomyces sp. NPDC006879 TaxID=3364767 RepID=UPI0036774911